MSEPTYIWCENRSRIKRIAVDVLMPLPLWFGEAIRELQRSRDRVLAIPGRTATVCELSAHAWWEENGETFRCAKLRGVVLESGDLPLTQRLGGMVILVSPSAEAPPERGGWPRG